MKKILKNLTLILLILIAILALAGCAIINTSNTTPQNTTCSGFVLPWRNYGDWHEVPDTVIISTHAELEEYCEKLDTDTNVMTDRMCRAIELFNKYDENYFKDNSLAIACMKLSTEKNDLQFNQATQNGDTVTIEYAITNNPEISLLDDSCGFIVVEIDKQVTNITLKDTKCYGFVLSWVSFEENITEIPEQAIISSRDELEKYCEKLEPDTTSSTEHHPINLFDKYDEEYFKDSSLAILQIQSFSYENLNFTQATKDGDSVKIEYKITHELTVSSAIKDYRYIVVEIDKQIANIIESEKE